MTEPIRTSLTGSILHIEFNRPEKKNALTLAMYEALVAAFARARDEAAIRVVLLSGAGGSFTSGNDLKDFMQAPPTSEDSAVMRFLMALVEMPKPVVAAVEGLAVGVGTTMLLHCDLVYAEPDAYFMLPFVNLGLVAEAGSSLLLPRMMGHQRAAELLLLGEPFGAQVAREYGLVNAVYAANELRTRARQVAEKLAARPPAALRETKALMRAHPAELRAQMQREAALFAERLSSPEAMEAFTAFFERRAPDFSRFE